MALQDDLMRDYRSYEELAAQRRGTTRETVKTRPSQLAGTESQSRAWLAALQRRQGGGVMPTDLGSILQSGRTDEHEALVKGALGRAVSPIMGSGDLLSRATRIRQYLYELEQKRKMDEERQRQEMLGALGGGVGMIAGAAYGNPFAGYAVGSRLGSYGG